MAQSRNRRFTLSWALYRVLTLELAHIGRGRQVREVGSESFEVSVAKHGRRCISPPMTLRLCASNSTDGPADVSKWGDLASGTNSKEASQLRSQAP